MSNISMTTISSMRRIEVFGPNKSEVTMDKDGKYQSINQKWQGNKKNRVQIVIGQQEIPTVCLKWAMVKAMIEAKIITVGATTAAKKTAAQKKAEKEAQAKAKAEAEAADTLPPKE